MKKCEQKVKEKLWEAVKAKNNIQAKLSGIKLQLLQYTEQFPEALIKEGSDLSWELAQTEDEISLLMDELMEVETECN